jgi:hypothetical protein
VEAVLTMAHDVFISHSSVDKPAADAACAALEARGIRCWITPRDINPGQDWAASIMQAIEGTRILLLVFSRSAKESIQVRREVAQAANSGKQILNLRIEDVRPEAELKFYLDSPHWLDAITKPFEAHLKRLADACAILLAPLDTDHDSATSDAARPQLAGGTRNVAWWRRQRQPVKVALVAAVIGVLAAVAGLTGHLLRPSAAHETRPPGTSFAASAPPPNPAGSLEARAQIVQLTGSWSDDGFHKAVRDRDTRIVALYLQSGMKATTLDQGASVILYGFQGLQQNGDPVELVKTFQAAGFKVDDELEDSYLMDKLSVQGPRSLLPMPFKSPLAPKGYVGGYGGTFVGSLLFWIVQRSTWVGTDEDNQVMKYLIDQGADCKVPLSFLDYQKMVDIPQHQLMKSCAK